MNPKADLKYPFYISAAVALVSLTFVILTDNGILAGNSLYEVSWTCAFAAAAFLLTLATVVTFKLPGELERRIGHMIDFYALGTPNHAFENSLQLLKNPYHDNVRWLIAKFISQKLGKDFGAEGEGEINIDDMSAVEYSALLSDLIGECRREILMTFDYTPREWLMQLHLCEETDCVLCKVPKNGYGLPKHLEAIGLNNRKITKMRLVTKSWFSLPTDEKRCAGKVIRLGKKVGVGTKALAENNENSEYLEQCRGFDYNILDGIVVGHAKENNHGGGRPDGTEILIKPRQVKLVFGSVLTQKYRRIFEIKEQHRPINLKTLFASTKTP